MKIEKDQQALQSPVFMLSGPNCSFSKGTENAGPMFLTRAIFFKKYNHSVPRSHLAVEKRDIQAIYLVARLPESEEKHLVLAR
ncbi:hypothetical protein [Siphonobacter aquaeclarae]|uniref:hypothetical protein n=1 Tax=Siphonobacter aquaeclarae TaxID=563176 RepID=UPI000B8756AD|nr:hypothetical protein [Siphonobacter aquaeclarae]